MLKVNHDKLKYIIRKCHECKKPLYIWGGTGVGKSRTVREEAKRIGEERTRTYVEWNKLSKDEKHQIAEHPDKYFFLMDIRLSQLDPSDLRGLPGLNGKDVVEWKIPFWLYVANLKHAEGIIFLDEINLAPPSIQAAAYQLILDRELGETKLAKEVITIAAGNREEDRANIYNLPRPLQNRFNHVELKAPHIDVSGKAQGDWAEWAIENGVDSRIVGFLTKMPGKLNPPINKNTKERVFPTPRGWAEYCSPLIIEIPNTQLNIIEELASISVGCGVAKEFVSYIKFQNEIDFYKILQNPKLAKDLKGLDLNYALISLVAEWYNMNYKLKKGEKHPLEKVLQISSNLNQEEFSMLLLRFCRARHPDEFRRDIITVKSWNKVRETIKKFLLS